MKIVKLNQPALAGFALLLLLALLPGFTAQKNQLSPPVPFDNPTLALYHNFAISGVYDFDENSEIALASLSAEISLLMPATSAWEKTEPQARIKFLQQCFGEGSLKPEEMFFFFRDSAAFALIINGSFILKDIAGLLPGSGFNPESGRLRKSFNFGTSKLCLEIDANQILFYPESAATEIFTRLGKTESRIDKKFKAFISMLKGKPALAAEIDFSAFSQAIASSSLRIPPELDQIKHLRLIADSQLAKMQLYVPENSIRGRLSEQIDLKKFSQLLTSQPELKISEKGASIFIETQADAALEKSVSQKFAAVLLHFLIKNSFKSVSAENNEQQRIE